MSDEKYDPAIHGRFDDNQAAGRRLQGLPAPPRNDPRPRHDRRPVPPPDGEFKEGDLYKLGHEIRPGVFCDRPLGHVLAGLEDERGLPEDNDS